MRNQYIIIHSWMLRFRLSPAELLTLAVIHSYTGFRGLFDGDNDWLARWACVRTDSLGPVLDGLLAKGLITEGRGRWGNTTYRSEVFENAAPPRDNNINNIDNMDNTDKKNNTDISSVPMGNITIEDKNNIDNTSAEAANAPSERARSADEELRELIAPYKSIFEVPIDILAKRAAERDAALKAKSGAR